MIIKFNAKLGQKEQRCFKRFIKKPNTPVIVQSKSFFR